MKVILNEHKNEMISPRYYERFFAYLANSTLHPEEINDFLYEVKDKIENAIELYQDEDLLEISVVNNSYILIRYEFNGNSYFKSDHKIFARIFSDYNGDFDIIINEIDTYAKDRFNDEEGLMSFYGASSYMELFGVLNIYFKINDNIETDDYFIKYILRHSFKENE